MRKGWKAGQVRGLILVRYSIIWEADECLVEWSRGAADRE
jgi:hypothetical protein